MLLLLTTAGAFQHLLVHADEDGLLVRDRRRIARNYLTGWFWLDFFSSLPYDNMFEETGLAFSKATRVGI